MEIKDLDHIQQVILTQNATKLGAAHGLPFTIDPLAANVGPHGDTSTADELLGGIFDVNQVDDWTDAKHRPKLKMFLTHL